MPGTPDTSAPPATAPPTAPGGTPWKPLFVAVFLAAAVAVLCLSPIGSKLKDIPELAHELSGRLNGMGATGVLAFCGGVFLLTAAGVPRLALCALGGAVYGFWWGMAWTQLPTLAGYYVTFLFVRWGGRDYVLRRWPRVTKLHAVLGSHSAWKIVMIRQMPITGIIVNFFLGLSPVRHRDFLLGTFIGLFPQAIPVTLLGSTARHMNKNHQFLILGATVLLFAGYILFRRFARRRSGLSGGGVENG
jgi:uncharacterized membrane protein YdjX (TVP38/TMEM64 family)